MASKLYLGVRLNPVEKMTVIKIDEINLKETVEKLRNETAQQVNLSSDAFDLIYCGCLLENNSSLESYGLKSGSMVHVLKRNESKESTSAMSTSSSNADVDALIGVYKSFAVNPLLELAMRRLTKKSDFIKNIISSCPGLSDDTIAVAILQDPDLIIHFTNAETLQKIAKTHPALLEAAQNIASAVHEEAHNFAVSTANAASPSGSAPNMAMANSYNLENFSDDEEMAADSSQSSDSTQPSNSNSRSQSIISPAQLFAAIQRARRSTSGNGGNTSSDASPSVPSSSQSSSANSGGVITYEMFSQAMQQAFATSAMSDIASNAPATSATAPASAPVDTPNASSADDIQRQVTIMHEMGLRNDAVNLQALQITNGDVQAAIELVLSGFGDN